LGGFGYGYWNGHASHWYVQAGGSGDLQPCSPLLFAGYQQQTEQEACEAMGRVWNNQTQTCEEPPNCPIIIATSTSAAYKLTSAEDGVSFDLNDDGAAERVAWTEPKAEIAFLAIDRDGDGMITSGKELFGNHTLPGISNGFDALIKMVRDSDNGIVTGSVNIENPLFARLLLWTDTNHNGVSEPSELVSVSELFSDIGLGYQIHNRVDGHGNRFAYRGWATVRTSPGRNRSRTPAEMKTRGRIIYDVVLTSR
jgi:hypothetical protein